MKLSPSVARLAGSVVVILLASVRCQVGLDAQPLQRFETCDALQVYLEDQILHPGVEVSVQSVGALEGCVDLAPPSAGLADASEGESNAAVKRAFTTTTTQDVNVDEPDFVKNNGDLIFVLRRGEMIILSAWPAEDMNILSRTNVGGTPFTMIFSDLPDTANDRALVVSNFISNKRQTLVKLYDTSDPTLPVELRSILIDGTFVDARAVGTEVMFVTRAELVVDVQLSAAPFSDDANRALLHEAGLTRMLPQISDFIVGTDASPRVDRAVACENTYAPSVSDGRNILLVHSMDLANSTSPLRSTGVVAGFSHVYASTQSLYLASTETADGGYFTPSFSTTRIHKLTGFEDTGTGAALYQATTVLTGQIKDELSLDEDNNGLLRVVLTDDSTSADLALKTTSLVVLEQPVNSTDLVEVSRADDIGRGENVESVRFIGDKAYVVTYPAGAGLAFPSSTTSSTFPSIPFTDPLFVIDLSDPRNPTLRGDLEVGGYSAYIHPLDETHLLTIGANTDASSGAFLGLSILVFDVTNPDAPALLHRRDFGNPDTGSEALVERHAFTYFASEGVLAVPVQRFASDFGALSSTALAVFRIDIDDGITPLGEIEQADLYTNLSDDEQLARDNGPCASVRRSVMIADDVDGAFAFAISAGGVTAAALEEGLPTVATVQLRGRDDATCDFSGSPL